MVNNILCSCGIDNNRTWKRLRRIRSWGLPEGICFVPRHSVAPIVQGINGILYAQPIADVISAIVTVFMALHLHKELAATKRALKHQAT